MAQTSNPRLVGTNYDPELTAAVLAELERDAFLRSLSLGMQVLADKNGIVTLVGSMESEQDRQAVLDSVSSIEGVSGVNNQLTLMGRGSNVRPDAELQQEILEQIQSDPTLERPERFHVSVRFGEVTVVGPVESEEEHESVLAAVHRVPGVQGIRDRLQVHIPTLQPRSPS